MSLAGGVDTAGLPNAPGFCHPDGSLGFVLLLALIIALIVWIFLIILFA